MASNCAEKSEFERHGLKPLDESDACYPPLRQAAAESGLFGPEQRTQQGLMMAALLKDPALDIYQLFQQPLRPKDPNTRSPFPGERQPAGFTGTTHLYVLSPRECWPLRRARKESVWIEPPNTQPLEPLPGHMPAEVMGTSNPWILYSNNTWEPWVDNYEENDEDFPIQYALRSVIHSIFEDGLFCQPILDLAANHTISLNLEQRSPEGCTLLLSACQSKLGADAKSYGAIDDVAWNVNTGDYSYDPFPLAPLHTFTLSSSGNEITSTALHVLLTLGADPFERDHQGQNALHHLLNATDPWTYYGRRPPVIRSSLNFLASKFPALLNQVDHSGTYPLHAALRRLRRYPEVTRYRTDAALEECVLDLISLKGPNDESLTNVCVRDARGNTALHYVADEGLLEIRNGQATRRLFRALLDHPDIKNNKEFINARNSEGRTALELILDDNGSMAESRIMWYGQMRNKVLPHADEVDTEVLGWLDSEGVDWRARDGNGRTLLHVIACHATERAGWRCRFLLDKGVDPSVCDTDGKTALDLAITYDNHDVISLLNG